MGSAVSPGRGGGEEGGGRWFQVEFQAPAQHPVAAVQKRLGPQGEDLVGTGAPKLGKSSELLMSGACGRKNNVVTWQNTGLAPGEDYG